MTTTTKRIKTRRKLLMTLLIVGMLGSLASVATWSAFSETTTSSDNSFQAGTVALSDNDQDGFMYQVENAKPGVTTTRCIKVAYDGSLDADVRLYTPTTAIPAAADSITLAIDKGTATGAIFPGCGVFTTQSTIYSGNLYHFQQNRNSYENGVAAYPGSEAKWIKDDSLVYRFRLGVTDAGNGVTSEAHEFVWEAQNQ